MSLYYFLLTRPEGKFLVSKSEFEGSFGMSLEGDFHEFEVTPNLELLVAFGMSLEGVCHGFVHSFTRSLYLICKQSKIPRRKLPPN
jgi:hypothetical protein